MGGAGPGLGLESPPVVPPPPTPPTVPRGHGFGAGQRESPILKHSAIFNPWPAPSAARGSPSGRRTHARLPPRPVGPRALGSRPSRPGPSRGRRAHARTASRSHWLLPVANPRDRRRRAPPPNPAPAGSRSAARGRLRSAARPADCALRAAPERPAAPTRWQCRAVCALAGSARAAGAVGARASLL